MATLGSSVSTSGAQPTYDAPAYDWSRVQGLTQEQMYPGMSAYRRGLQSVLGKAYANPMEMSQAYKSAMQGYGEGLGSLQSGATTAAISLYQPEYDAATAEAQSAYESDYQKWLDEEAAKKAKTTTTGLTGNSFMPEYTPTYATTSYSPQYFQTSLPSTKGSTSGAGSPVGYFGQALTGQNETVYGAGSEEAWKKANWMY